MTRAKQLVTICQIEWSRSLEYASIINLNNLALALRLPPNFLPYK